MMENWQGSDSIQREISPIDSAEERTVWTADTKGAFIFASAWGDMKKVSTAVRWHQIIWFQAYTPENFLVRDYWRVNNS